MPAAERISHAEQAYRSSWLAVAARQMISREVEIPRQAGRVGHRVLVDDLLDRVAEQELLDRQLLLLARERARDLRHGENLVGQEAPRQAGFDRAVDAALHRRIERNAWPQHDK